MPADHGGPYVRPDSGPALAKLAGHGACALSLFSAPELLRGETTLNMIYR